MDRWTKRMYGWIVGDEGKGRVEKYFDRLRREIVQMKARGVTERKGMASLVKETITTIGE